MKTIITRILAAAALCAAVLAPVTAYAQENNSDPWIEVDAPEIKLGHDADGYLYRDDEGSVRCTSDIDGWCNGVAGDIARGSKPEDLVYLYDSAEWGNPGNSGGVLLAQADTTQPDAEPDATSAADIAAGVMDEPPVEQPRAEVPKASADSPRVVLVEKPSEAMVTVHRLATMVIELLVWPILLALVLLIRKGLKKLGVDMDAKKTELLMAGAKKAKGYGEQQAIKWAKQGLTWEPGDKLKEAMRFGTDLAEKQKWDKWMKDKLEDFIEAQLGEDNEAAGKDAEAAKAKVSAEPAPA